ncbi:MAG: 5-bromo-4-chloroindolyl phosphate hydrolysis family protein [Oscillospiraceae bacterium]
MGVLVAGRLLFQDKTYTVPDPEPEPEPLTPDQQALQDLCAERDRVLLEMHRLNDAIADEKISAQIDHLEEDTRKIVAVVVKDPAKLPQLRKFLNYYLPTTLKILNAYDRMDSAGVAGSNIDGTMGKIETMMDTVVLAFDKQLDSLFGDEAMDIGTDITVLEQMLAREGIGGTQIPTN